MVAFRCKSIKGWFGKFKSMDEAQTAADEANLEQKNGAGDWVAEEVEEKGPSSFTDALDEAERVLNKALGIAQQAGFIGAPKHLQRALESVRAARGEA